MVCANGMVVQPHQCYDGLKGFDFVVVPGGRGVDALREDTALLADLSRFHRAGGLLCSVCTGALILAWAGVLEGRRATTHHSHREKLAPYCQVVDQRVVADGNIITAAGVSASLDLGFVLLERFYGAEVARQVAGRIEYCW
ncbi:MAG TPA: DJ-1/PfpI family protein [Caldilineae bacterium]|nr:DJ-1/PfpI family protein [Caldilineae bacterium]